VDSFFFGKTTCRTRRRVILEGLFAVDFACGGAYPVGCWGVVQSVGHLTVNEDGGGSNPPAPANFLDRDTGISGVVCFYTDCITFIYGPISLFST
jgi:hypothetical protein